MRIVSGVCVTLVYAILWGFGARDCAAQTKDVGWPNYGNDAGGARFSEAKQIDRSNVGQLKVAWTFRTGALDEKRDLNQKATFETTPILADGKLYLSTPWGQVFALDPATGTKIWEFDPDLDLTNNYSEATNRGVSAWHDSKAKRGAPCALRIFIGTIDARLIAIDGA
ncbi:MAG: PQQ-binding-like beta-propeller repeat protein, partial [Acidobacteria bacterium]|nr:PQQ-binding-like beta-propeller repeat protein [Acidobacteriota bacterium]